MANTRDAVIRLSPDGRITTLNPGAGRLFGLSGSEAIGQPCHVVLSQLGEALHRATGSDEDQLSFDVARQLHDGTSQHLAVTVAATRGANGVPAAWTAIISDVTELRRLDADREEAVAFAEALLATAPQPIVLADPDGTCTHVNPAWVNVTGLGPAESEGAGWWQGIHPGDRDVVGAALATPHLAAGAIECRLLGPSGAPISTVLHIGDAGSHIGKRVLAWVDLSGIEEVQGARMRAQSLGALADTTALLGGDEDLTSLLHTVAGRARELTNADFAAISTFDERGVLERFIYSGMPEELAARIGAPPVGRGLLGLLARHDRPIRIADLQQHESFTGWPEVHPDMCAFLGVPIRAGGRTIGSFYMTRTRGEPPFSDDDEFAATVLALQVALSVSAALAHERRGRVSLLEERVRIAHDLHDGTIQALYALGLELDASLLRPEAPEDWRDLLSASVARINQLITDIRNYIEMLEAETPPTDPELSRDLPFIIQQLVPAGVDTVLNVSAPALQEFSSRDVEDLLFVAREALSNAIRHGSPSRIAVDLRQTPDETALTVQDNGSGFEPATARVGLGTTTMRTRAHRIGGTLTVLSIPGMGTTVRVSVPRFRSEDA